MMTRRQMKKMAFRLPADQVEKLKEVAAKHGLSVQLFLESIVMPYLNDESK